MSDQKQEQEFTVSDDVGDDFRPRYEPDGFHRQHRRERALGIVEVIGGGDVPKEYWPMNIRTAWI